jgi:glycosyltransferase involved in cell wall biosynthesis
MTKKLRIAIVGTQGVPNAYGGFETLAEFLVQYLSNDFDLTVYCSSKDQKTRPASYHGAALRYLPISSHGVAGMLYDSLALAHARFTHDVILFLGFGAGFIAPALPGLRRRLVLNFGGLDWKREKWSPQARRVIKQCERWLVGNSGRIVADNELIADYLRDEYGRKSELIAYGGDQALMLPISAGIGLRYPFLNQRYALAVARIQADNNIDMLLAAFPDDVGYPFVFIGNWAASAYGRAIREEFAGARHLILLDAIYDRQVLDVIRSNCHVYIHGHSAGGTNPSLCEAMNLGLPVIAYSSGYNERTMADHGWFFGSSEELNLIIKTFDRVAGQLVGARLREVAGARYTWAAVAKAYARLFRENQ